MAYPKSNDPVRPRGVSIPESLWECLKDHAKAESRTTSAFITILLFEAVCARMIAVGLKPPATLEELYDAVQETNRLKREHPLIAAAKKKNKAKAA